MRRIVIYCSNTGMTKQVATTIARELECDCYEIKANDTVNSEDFDSYSDLIIGTPVRYASIHPTMKNFLLKMDFTGRKVFPFITHGGVFATIKSEFAKTCTGARMYELLKIHTIRGEFRTPKEDILNWCKLIKSNSIL